MLNAMKNWMATLVLCRFITAPVTASTIMVVPVYEPLSLHGTDGDEAISDIGDALQASVMPRPMALTGAFPEVLIDAIKSPHKIPTNHPNYKIIEANLLVLCNININAEMAETGLTIRLNVANLTIPAEVDLTTRQILKLAIIAIRKTLEEYQNPQPLPLTVTLTIDGANEGKATLRDLGTTFTLDSAPLPN